MNWEALGAIAEFLGAIGVILTLLYLSRQIQHNSRQLEGSSTIAVHEYERSMIEDLCANKELWEIVKKGNGDWESLSEDEQSYAALWNIKEAGYWEMAYRLHQQGALNPIVYYSKESYYLELFQAQGRRKWWDEHNTLLQSRDFYNEMTAKLDAKSTTSSDFKEKHSYWVKEKAK
jgi:hypothetical protein